MMNIFSVIQNLYEEHREVIARLKVYSDKLAEYNSFCSECRGIMAVVSISTVISVNEKVLLNNMQIELSRKLLNVVM